MSDVWPPPPKNQPASKPPQNLPSGGFGAILYVSLGALMLVPAGAVTLIYDLAPVKHWGGEGMVIAGLIFPSFMLLLVGTWAAYHTRNTRNGRAALLVACGTLIVFGSLFLLPLIYHYF